MNIFGDSAIQSSKSGRTRKSGLVPMSRHEGLRIYSWYSLPDLKHEQKRFIRSPSLSVPAMALFSQFYQTVTIGMMTVRQILTSVLAVYFQVLVTEENIINDQNFQIVLSDHLEVRFV